MMKKTPSLKNGCTHFMRDTWNEGNVVFIIIVTSKREPTAYLIIRYVSTVIAGRMKI